MNEKNYKKIIVILSVVCAIAIGFSIYYAFPGKLAYAEQLRNTISELRTAFDEQRENNEQLLADISAANERATELDGKLGRVEQLARSADGIITDIRTTVQNSGGTIQQLIERQRLIAEGVRRLQANNQQLKDELSQRDSGS